MRGTVIEGEKVPIPSSVGLIRLGDDRCRRYFKSSDPKHSKIPSECQRIFLLVSQRPPTGAERVSVRTKNTSIFDPSRSPLQQPVFPRRKVRNEVAIPTAMTRTPGYRRAKRLWDHELPAGGSEFSDGLRNLVVRLSQQKRVIVFKGAGVSVAAGIPPFRSEDGIFAQYKLGEKLFHVDMFKNAVDRTTYLQACDNLYEKSEAGHPTKFDQSIATWENVGRIFTTNIDGIGTKDDAHPALNTTLPPTEPWPKTIALHGLLTYVFCDKCRRDFEYDVNKHGRFVDETECLDCGDGVLRPRVALYGDTDGTFTFDTKEHERVIENDLLQGASGLVVAGTTLKVIHTQNTVKLFWDKIKEVHEDARGCSIWINPTDLPPEDMRSLFTKVRGTADEFARVYESCLSDHSKLTGTPSAARVGVTDVPSVPPSAKKNRRFNPSSSDSQLPDACDNEVNKGLTRWALDQLNVDQLKKLTEGKVPRV